MRPKSVSLQGFFSSLASPSGLLIEPGLYLIFREQFEPSPGREFTMSTETKAKKLGLTTWILISMIAGIAIGTFLYYLLPETLRPGHLALLSGEPLTELKQMSANHWINYYLIDGIFNIGASIFLRTLKMLVVPLVFVSLVCGTSSLGDPKLLGRVGGKTLGFYILTTALAISLSLLLASFLGVGEGSSIDQAATYSANAGKPLSEVIIDMVPSNPIQAMADGVMLQVIFFSILFGLSLTLIGESGKSIIEFFNNINEVIMKMITILMSFAPIGVFCVVAKVFGEKGLDPIQGLMKYFIVVIAALLLHVFLTYGSLLKFIAKLSPYRFFENIRPAVMMAFSTSSSNATIPVTLETVEKRMGVNNSVASFTIPLGATINMDGTSIMQGVATVFIANAAGIDLTFNQYLMVILTATFASVGTAGVPGVGMITLAMVLQQVGLPEQGILLLLPVDRILDMCRTAVNICGDAAVTCTIAKAEKQFDQKTFDQPLGEHYGEYSFEHKGSS